MKELKLDHIATVTVDPHTTMLQGNKYLDVNGTTLRITKAAYKDILKMAAMSNKTVNHLDTNINRGISASIIRELFKSMTDPIKLFVNTTTKEVERVVDNDVDINPNLTSYKLLGDVATWLKEKGGIDFKGGSVVQGGLGMKLNMSYNNPIQCGIQNEDITYGKTFNWNLIDGMTSSDFIERLVCTNGMTSFKYSNTVTYNNDATKWNALYEEFINPNAIVVGKYKRAMKKARRTQLSLRELFEINDALEPFNDDAPRIMQYMGDFNWIEDYKDRGIDVDKLTMTQKAQCPTPINAWDAINCLTDLGSHKYHSDVSNEKRASLQSMGGKMLTTKWDSDNWISNVPTYERSPLVETIAN